MLTTKTRYTELNYGPTYPTGWTVRPDGWRFQDASTGNQIGPRYATRLELLADLERFASLFGCEGASVYGSEVTAANIND